MNDTLYPEARSDEPWPAHDRHMPVPDTSMLPGSEQAPPAAVNVLKHAVRGAHETIDRLADSAAPAVRQLGETLSTAEDALRANAGQVRETGTEWVETLRGQVRARPLASVAAALAFGAVIARITR